MNLTLSPNETRVLGVLIEKAITTPDQYPLSLNALNNGCNQKSNREPVVNWEESEVRAIVDELVKKRLVREDTGYSRRVVKFKHWFCNTEFGDLKLTEQELAIICVLFLRGPQTPGELRTRTNRLCQFSDVSVVESTLAQLMDRDDGPFLVKLEREPGKRDSRYAHLFCGKESFHIASANVNSTANTAGHINTNTIASDSSIDKADRVAVLEQQVLELQDDIVKIKSQLAELFD
ncbi:MAG: DUF480 domain-containing protein [Pseudomonadales bacterium]|nr:DUF480 domain-containing protein [Pseudomonadales bacterium]